MGATMVMLALLAAGPGPAQGGEAGTARVACPTMAAPPAEFAGWTKRAAQPTAASGEGPEIAVGKGYDVTLRPSQQLRMANLPGPVRDRVGYGGIVHFSVARAGIYRVALGGGAWVDVVRDGKALDSVGHGHGPDCTGIAKIVDFELAPGRYRLTLDGSDGARTGLLVAASR